MISIYRASRGYVVEKTGRKWTQFLESIYNGKAKWTLDHTYAKHYKSVNSAAQALQSIGIEYREA